MIFKGPFQPSHALLQQTLEPALARLILVEELGRAGGVLHGG